MKNRIKLIIIGLCAVMVIFTIFMSYGLQSNKKSFKQNNSTETGELDDFLFVNYQNLSIKQYRDKVIDLAGDGNSKYSWVLNAVENNEDPHKLYNIDSDEYILYNFIIPTIADKWLNWNLNSGSSNAKYQIEYSIHYQILNPEKVTVNERNSAVRKAYKVITDLEKYCSDEKYKTEDMQYEFDKQAKLFAKEVSNENFKISITGVCREEDEDEKSLKYTEHTEEKSVQQEGEKKLQDEFLDKDKYMQVLSLNDKEIYDRTVNDFRERYINKIQSEEFQESQGKIYRSIVEGNPPKYLTDEDIDFLTITLEATAQEVISIYQKKTDKTSIEYRVDNTDSKEIHKFFMNYQLLYTISDDTKFLLRDRDSRIKSIKNAIEEYFENKMKDKTIDSIDNIKSFCEQVVNEQSNTDIKFEIVINSCKIGDKVLN